MANYLTYPCKVMRITQSYDGETSHKPHMTGTPKDYSLDEGCTDGGRDWIYCSCDKLKVVRITGTKDSHHTNAIWLTSTEDVDLANGKKAIVTLQFVHPNDDDLLKVKVGHIFKRGDKICREGNDGATANHLHVAVGLGKMVGTGWTTNSKGAWVLTTTGGAIKPEDAFYVDPDFTKIVKDKGLKFKLLPTNPTVGKYKVACNVLNVMEGTKERDHIVDVLTKGTVFEVSKIKVGWNDEYWGKINKVGWACLKQCKKV